MGLKDQGGSEAGLGAVPSKGIRFQPRLKGKVNRNTVTKTIFWLAFAAFLSVSIPHIAWVYHAFEDPAFYWWWVASYSVGVVIDLTICWLTYVKSSDRTGVTAGVTWVFISLLVCFSWYFNYLYSVAHNPSDKVNVWDMGLPFGLNTGTLTPVIISAVPVFSLAYAFMFSRVADAKGETLEEKAERLERERVLRARIREAQKGRFVIRAKSGITGMRDIAKELIKATRDIRETPPGHSRDISRTQAGHSLDISRTQAGHLLDISGADTGDGLGYLSDIEVGGDGDKNGIQDRHKRNPGGRSTGALYIDLGTASKRYKYSEAYLRKLIHRGKIRTHRENKERIIESSLRDYARKSGRRTRTL